MSKLSTMKPFAPGDIFLGCTYLMNVPGDDHAGEGRILQFDRNMVPKGTLYTEGTGHLIVNLRFGPDGSVWLGEYLKGDKPYQGGDMRCLAGTTVVGYGRIAKFNQTLRPLAEYDAGTVPSVTGFHGVTHTVMHPGGAFITYITDLGMRVYRLDVASGKPLPDLVTYPGGPDYVRKWTTGVACRRDGTLLLLRGSFIDCIDPEGRSLRTIPLDEYGYAMITASTDERHAFCANIFTGVMRLYRPCPCR